MHPSRLAVLPENAGIRALIARTADFDPPPSLDELQYLMNEAAKELSDDDSAFRKHLDDFNRKRFLREPYPDRRGIVLTTRKRIKGSTSSFLPTLDDGDDETSRIGHVLLADHTDHVVKKLARTLKSIRTSVADEAFRITATLHDWGKVDERFQAMLSRTDRTGALLYAGGFPQLLAKSDRMARTPSDTPGCTRASGPSPRLPPRNALCPTGGALGHSAEPRPRARTDPAPDRGPPRLRAGRSPRSSSMTIRPT